MPMCTPLNTEEALVFLLYPSFISFLKKWTKKCTKF